MLRGPVQASFPSLETFPRETGMSGHVYPFSARSASPIAPQAESFRLPSNIVTSTFWRSPYSEARQSRSSVSRRAEGCLPGRDCASSLGQEADKEKHGTEEPASDAQKNEGKDSGSDMLADNVLQLRGILCKSSLSCSSRQSGPKVQKRVKFDESVDKGQSPRQSVSANCGRTTAKQDSSKQQAHRILSASMTGKSTVRMPSLPHPSERQQQGDSTAQPSPSSSSSPIPSLPLNPHQYPHIPRAGSGPLIRTSNVSELTLPRPASKSVGQNSYLKQSAHSVQSPTGPGSSSSRISSTPLDFRINRQPSMMGGNGGGVCDGRLSHSPYSNKGRYFASHGHSTGARRSLVRLSRSFTSPAITLHHPVKRPIPSSSSNDDLPMSPSTSGVGVNQDSWEKFTSARDVMQAFQAMEEEADRRDSYLDDDKTVQILHWLKEVGHRQAWEGRCPAFTSGTCRDA